MVKNKSICSCVISLGVFSICLTTKPIHSLARASVRLCLFSLPNIEPYVSWMSGFPTETEEDLKKTFDLRDEMNRTNPKTQHFGIFTYTPLSPNSLTDLLGSDFMPPQSLEEWGNVDVFHFCPTWHSEKYVEKLHAVAAVTKYVFYPQMRVKEWSLGYRLSYGSLNRLARFRWKHRFFRYPIELKIVDSLTKKSRGYL
jgi:hypothetical protein